MNIEATSQEMRQKMKALYQKSQMDNDANRSFFRERLT